jgi:phosphatidylserine synthase
MSPPTKARPTSRMNAVRQLTRRNLANIVSILGVLPLAVLFLDNGFVYIVPLMILNNIMDDLDGIVANKLNIKSDFGAALDNVCDLGAHVIFVLMIGAHFGWSSGIFALAATTAVIIRITSRVTPGARAPKGSPTNELIRHLIFILILLNIFDFNISIVLAITFTLHTVSMLVPYPMPALIRSRTKTNRSIALLNASLVLAWLIPYTAPVIAAAFFTTYLYALIYGGIKWSRHQKAAHNYATDSQHHAQQHSVKNTGD